MRPYNLYINGKFVPATHFIEHRPPHKKVIDDAKDIFKVATLSSNETEDGVLLEASLLGASESFRHLQSGAFFPLNERLDFLEKLRNRLSDQQDFIAECISLEVAKPISLARVEVQRCLATLDWTLKESPLFFSKVGLPTASLPQSMGLHAWTTRHGRGPLLAITPFNFPLNLVMHKLAPALASGCPVILKASPKASVVSLLIADLCHASGLPPGMLSVLQADNNLTRKLIHDSRVAQLSFTGSSEIGWMLFKEATKPVFLELGGFAPAYVGPSANLRDAAQKLISGAMTYAGQSCISVQNIFVQKDVRKEFEVYLAEEITQLNWGSVKDEKSIASSVIDAEAAQRLRLLEKSELEIGTRIIAKAKPYAESTEDDNFICPTLFSTDHAMSSFFHREIFGPYVNLCSVPNFETWLNLANAQTHRLQAAVFSHEPKEIFSATERLQYGGVIVNESSTTRLEPMPYGGEGLSGLGREGPRYAMEDYCSYRSSVVRLS